MSFNIKVVLFLCMVLTDSIYSKPAVNNSLYGSNSNNENEPSFSSNFQNYVSPQFKDYGDYNSANNQQYMNGDNAFYSDDSWISTNSDPMVSFDNLNNKDSINSYNNPSFAQQNEKFSSPDIMWNEFLSPQDVKPIPEYDTTDYLSGQNYPINSQRYPSYNMQTGVSQNDELINSNIEYDVNEPYPIANEDYQTYGEPQNVGPNKPFEETISEYQMNEDYPFQPQYPNYGVPQTIEPNNPFEYPSPQPNYPNYGIPQNIEYNTPCNPCQWYDPCCYQNCIRICDQVPEPTYPPFPWPPTPDPVPSTTPAPITTTSSPEPECQVPGWNTITVGDKTFEIYVSDTFGNDKTLSWFEADSMARDVGGYLAEITSEEETALLNGIKKCYPFGPIPWFWIGGNDLANYTHWVWTRGSPVGPYENWYNPNAKHDPKNKCMMLKFEIDQEVMDYQEDIQLNNKWYKENCKGVRNPTAFLAERIEGTIPPPTPGPTTPTRPTVPTTTATTTTTGPDDPTEQPPQ